MTAPLKPCPFCGGASKWRPGVHSPPRPYDEILCPKGCVGMGVQQRHWNRRAPDRAALVEVARRASACGSGGDDPPSVVAERIVTEYLDEQEGR